MGAQVALGRVNFQSPLTEDSFFVSSLASRGLRSTVVGAAAVRLERSRGNCYQPCKSLQMSPHQGVTEERQGAKCEGLEALSRRAP